MPNTKRKCIDRPPPQFNSQRKRHAKSVFDRLGDKKGNFHNGSTLVVSIPFDQLESHHHVHDGGWQSNPHSRKGHFHSGNISGSTFDRPEHHHIHDGGYGTDNQLHGRKSHFHSGNISGSTFDRPEHHHVHDGGWQSNPHGRKGHFHSGNISESTFDRPEYHHNCGGGYGAASHLHGRKGHFDSGNISGSTFDRPEYHHIHYDGHQAAKEMEFRRQRDLHGGVKHIRTNSGSIRGKGWRSKKWPTFTKSNFK